MKTDDLLREIPEWELDLRDGAWQILEDNPGITLEEWMDELCEQFPAEVVDTFGTEEEVVEERLRELWNETRNG